MLSKKEAIEMAIKEFQRRGLAYGICDHGLKDLGDKYVLTGCPYPGKECESDVCSVSIDKKTGEMKSYEEWSDENCDEYDLGEYLNIPKKYSVDIKLDKDTLIKCIKELTPQEDSFISFFYKGKYSGIHLKSGFENEIFRHETEYVVFCGDLFLARTSIEGILEGKVFDGKSILEIIDEIGDFRWNKGDDEFVYNVEFSYNEREIFEKYISEKYEDIYVSPEEFMKLVMFETIKDKGFIESLPKETEDIKLDIERRLDEAGKESVWLELTEKEYAMVGAYATQKGLSVVEAFKKAMKDDITKWVSDCESDN